MPSFFHSLLWFSRNFAQWTGQLFKNLDWISFVWLVNWEYSFIIIHTWSCPLEYEQSVNHIFKYVYSRKSPSNIVSMLSPLNNTRDKPTIKMLESSSHHLVYILILLLPISLISQFFTSTPSSKSLFSGFYIPSVKYHGNVSNDACSYSGDSSRLRSNSVFHDPITAAARSCSRSSPEYKDIKQGQ